MVTVEIPGGARPGTVIRVPGQGLPRLRGHGRGDLHLQVRIEIPRELSAERQALLMSFKNWGQEAPAPE